MSINKRDSKCNCMIRVRIHKKDSMYDSMLGEITVSTSVGTFGIKVHCEGSPYVELQTNEVEPC